MRVRARTRSRPRDSLPALCEKGGVVVGRHRDRSRSASSDRRQRGRQSLEPASVRRTRAADPDSASYSGFRVAATSEIALHRSAGCSAELSTCSTAAALSASLAPAWIGSSVAMDVEADRRLALDRTDIRVTASARSIRGVVRGLVHGVPVELERGRSKRNCSGVRHLSRGRLGDRTANATIVPANRTPSCLSH